jgi:translation initiation factor 2 subunit 1
MHYQRQGYPEESAIVLCTVTKILPNAVFATLDEYGHKSGLIHISEIAPGRIRNIRDYVEEGRKVVCRVLATRPDKMQIDLSLRRVNEMQKKQKSNAIKMEQKAEKLIEYIATQLKMDVKVLYDQIAKEALVQFEYIHECFDSIVASQFDSKKLKLEKKIEKMVVDTVKEKIKLPEVEILGTLTFKSWDEDGVEVIKKELTKMKKNGIQLAYLGSGKFKITIKAPDYELAEKIVTDNIDALAEKYEDSDNGTVSFVRL